MSTSKCYVCVCVCNGKINISSYFHILQITQTMKYNNVGIKIKKYNIKITNMLIFIRNVQFLNQTK